MKYVLFAVGILFLLTCVVIHLLKTKKKGVDNQKSHSSSDDKELALMDENKLKECLDLNNSWIGNSDEKASILLAMIGVVLTVFVTSDAIKVIRNYITLPFIQYCNGACNLEFNFSRFSVFIYLVFSVVFSALSLLKLLNTIRPNIDYEKFYKENPGMVKTSHIFYGHVAKMPYEKYQIEKFDYNNDLRSQVYVNSYIANEKFTNYIEALFWFKMTMLSAFMLFISFMFMQ